MNNNQLTEHQQKLYRFITNKDNYNPPTYKQMAYYMEVKSENAVRDTLKRINKKGFDIPFNV